METIKFIEQHGLQALTDVLGIQVKTIENESFGSDLICLNYNQIESPKLHPVVKECRGLILNKNTFDIVFRSMERFFNHNENGCVAKLDKDTDYFDKLDGSYIKIYHFDGMWYLATRGTIFANNPVNPFGLTFKQLVYKALGVENYDQFALRAEANLDKNISYSFEITSPDNRVVTPYTEYTLHYLNARITNTGEYTDQREQAKSFGAKLQTPLKFETVTEMEEYVKNLTGLQEGLVAYENGIPVAKIKNDVYIQVHHSRGEGIITPKRVRHLVLIQEHEEYLAYFPEDDHYFRPYIDAYNELINQFAEAWNEVKDISDKKEFALTVQKYPFKALLFTKYTHRDKPFVELLNNLKENSKQDLLETIKNLTI